MKKYIIMALVMTIITPSFAGKKTGVMNIENMNEGDLYTEKGRLEKVITKHRNAANRARYAKKSKRSEAELRAIAERADKAHQKAQERLKEVEKRLTPYEAQKALEPKESCMETILHMWLAEEVIQEHNQGCLPVNTIISGPPSSAEEANACMKILNNHPEIVTLRFGFGTFTKEAMGFLCAALKTNTTLKNIQFNGMVFENTCDAMLQSLTAFAFTERAKSANYPYEPGAKNIVLNRKIEAAPTLYETSSKTNIITTEIKGLCIYAHWMIFEEEVLKKTYCVIPPNIFIVDAPEPIAHRLEGPSIKKSMATLQNHPEIHTLCFESIHFSKADVEAFCTALKTNTTLKNIELNASMFEGNAKDILKKTLETCGFVEKITSPLKSTWKSEK